MIRLRPFTNRDTPRLAELWRSCVETTGLVQPMTTLVFDQYILSKPYFDRTGLILAEDDSGLVGFAHAGFGPTENGQSLDYELGVTCMLLVHPRVDFLLVATELLAAAENYLRTNGAKVLYAGALHPLTPFYYGFYGGSEMPGVLDANGPLQSLLQASGYQPCSEIVIYQKEFATHKPYLDRRMMMIRRRYQVAIVDDPPYLNWWEACTQGDFERRHFQLLDNQRGNQVASASLRFFDLPGTGIASGGCGFTNLLVDPALRRQGLGIYLITEMLKYLQANQCLFLEAQTMATNVNAIALYEKMGYLKVGTGTAFRKS